MFKKLCDEIRTMGTTEIILIGEGEPFLHPGVFDIISTAKDAGFKVTILTNGTLLDEAKIRCLVDSRLDILKVSLWASSTEEYERNYPGANPDNFRKITDALKLLTYLKKEHKSKFPSVTLHQPINSYNFKKIDEMIDLVCATGCNTLSFSPLKSRRGKVNSLALSHDEEMALCRYLTKTKRRLESLSINHNINNTLMRYKIGEAVSEKLPCHIAWLHARIKVDGTVLPCNPCDQPMGNLNQDRFPEIWNGPAYRAFRRKTGTRKGLTTMSKDCDCGFCCHVGDNLRINNIFKWLKPFLIRQKQRSL